MEGEKSKGRPLALDAKAASADPSLPAFLAKPKGAPVYHGFPILEDVVVEGFTLGIITDFESEPATVGDAFVVAPDGTRCGLAWQQFHEPRFTVVIPPEPDRWGVYDVNFQHPMDSRESARKNLQSIIEELKKRWSDWKQETSK
jgi:hypothetical protein